MRINEFDNKITQSDLEALETFADRIFGKVGIDVEFTRHFLDRVNDERNGKQITASELTRLFKQEYKKWGKPIAKMGPDAEAVMKDLQTDINMPFALRWDSKNNELDLIAKTVMRKPDFKTSNREFAVEKNPHRDMHNALSSEENDDINNQRQNDLDKTAALVAKFAQIEKGRHAVAVADPIKYKMDADNSATNTSAKKYKSRAGQYASLVKPEYYFGEDELSESRDYTLMAQKATMNLSDQAIVALIADLYKQLDRQVNEGEEDCSACNGTGWDKTVTSDEDERGCDECGGTGKIEESISEIEFGAKMLDQGARRHYGKTGKDVVKMIKYYEKRLVTWNGKKWKVYFDDGGYGAFDFLLVKPNDKYGDNPEATFNPFTKKIEESVINEESQIWKFNKEDPNNPEVLIQGFGRLMLNQIEDSVVGKLEDLVKRAKGRRDWQQIDSLLGRDVMQIMIKAIVDTKKDLEKTRKRGGPKSRGINKDINYESKERTSILDVVGESKIEEGMFDKLKVVKHKKAYERAADSLHTMLQRKYKENEGHWRHALGWYVANIADSFNNVDSKILHNFYLDNYKSAFITETGGVGKIVPGINTTIDVGPNEIKKQAAKFGNIVDKNGLPKKAFR